MLINSYELMKKVMTEIYPKELVLVPDDNNGCMAPFLDFQLLITEGVISTSICDMLLIFLLLISPTCQARSQIKCAYEHSFVN